MNDAMTEFGKVLAHFEPGWVLLIIVAAILAYRSPQLIKETFAGVNVLLITVDKIRRDKLRPKAIPVSDRPKLSQRAQPTTESGQSLAA